MQVLRFLQWSCRQLKQSFRASRWMVPLAAGASMDLQRDFEAGVAGMI